MFCPSCGEENPDDARFCGSCGEQCNTVKSEPPPSVTKLESPPLSNNKVPDGLKYGIIAGSVLFPFIGIIMGLIYLFGDGNEEKKSVGKLWLYSGIGLAFLYLIASGSGL